MQQATTTIDDPANDLLPCLIQSLMLIADSEDDYSCSFAAITMLQVIEFKQQHKIKTPKDFAQHVMLITECDQPLAASALNRCATLHSVLITGGTTFADAVSTSAQQQAFVDFIANSKFDITFP